MQSGYEHAQYHDRDRGSYRPRLGRRLVYVGAWNDHCVHGYQHINCPGGTRNGPSAIGRKMTAEKAKDYLRRAQEAEEQAKSAMSPDLKRRWEIAANGWRLMAEREQQRSERG